MDPYKISDESCSTLDGFVNAIHRLLNAAWGTGWGVFSEEEPTGNDPEKIPTPHITFELTTREISPELKNFRGKLMESFSDPDYPEFYIEVRKKFFKCRVTFKVWHKTNQGARAINEKLEYFLEHYVGYFKENGIMQLKFVKEGKPNKQIHARQLVPNRELLYDLYIVQNEITRTKLLNDITIKLQEKQGTTDTIAL